MTWLRYAPRRVDLAVIGVDELSFRRRHNYVTVVVDNVRQRIVWVGEGKSSDMLGEFFKALDPERAKLLTHVTMNLFAAYRSSVSEYASQAELVFDSFHIQRLASDAVDAVRRGEVRAAEDAETARSLKGTRWAQQSGRPAVVVLSALTRAQARAASGSFGFGRTIRPHPATPISPCRSMPSTPPSRRSSWPRRCRTYVASTTARSSSSTAATR
ncbi:MAG: transposase [Casimicrobiaceae bacterium]